MGEYDDISEERLRADLVRFAELILRLESEGGLLVSPADLQKMIGELRQKLFAWEIRRSRYLVEDESGPEADAHGDASASSPRGEASRESLRVVREALEREQQMIREWSDGNDGEPRD